MVFKKNITKWRFGHRFCIHEHSNFQCFTSLLCERHNTSCTRPQTNYGEISYNIQLGQTTSVIEPCHNPMCTTITNKNLYYEVTHKSIRISSDDYSSIYLSNDHVLHVFDNNTANALWAVLQLTIHLKTLWTGTVTANFPTIWFQDNIRCREEGCYCQRLHRAVAAFWQVPNDISQIIIHKWWKLANISKPINQIIITLISQCISDICTGLCLQTTVHEVYNRFFLTGVPQDIFQVLIFRQPSPHIWPTRCSEMVTSRRQETRRCVFWKGVFTEFRIKMISDSKVPVYLKF